MGGKVASLSHFAIELAETPRDLEETRLVESVKRSGGHAVTMPYNLDFGVPDYAHSVGFYANFGQPELIIMGVSAERGVLILSELRRRIANGMEVVDKQLAKGLFGFTRPFDANSANADDMA